MLSAVSAWAQSADVFDRTDGAEHGYGTSYAYYDICGDQRLGELYRQAIVEKVEKACPFTEKAKAAFKVRRAEIDAKAEEALRKVRDANGGQYPDQLNDKDGNTCSARHASKGFQIMSELLEQYEHGEVTVDVIVPNTCESGGAH